MVGRWQWPLRSTTAALFISPCSACCWAWRFCFARSMEAMVVVAPLTTRRERALRCALGRWLAACRRLLDEASPAGAAAAPGRSAASQTTRRRPRAPVAAWHGVTAALPAFAQTGWLGFSRRRATRHSVKTGVVRSARDGWARGAAQLGPLEQASLREALSPRASDGAAHRLALLALIAAAWRREVRSHVAGAATDNLQT